MQVQWWRGGEVQSGAEVQRWCRTVTDLVQRCRIAELQCCTDTEVVERWCRGGAEVVQRWCRGGAEVQVVQQGFRGGGGGCRGGADVQSCRVAELQRCRVAEVQSCRNAGADMIEKCRRGAEEYKCRCRVSAK